MFIIETSQKKVSDHYHFKTKDEVYIGKIVIWLYKMIGHWPFLFFVFIGHSSSLLEYSNLEIYFQIFIYFNSFHCKLHIIHSFDINYLM